MGGGGKGKGDTQVQSVNPYAAAQADFLYNRPSQYTPFGNLIFSQPGQPPPPSTQVQFLPGQLTGAAQQIFGPAVDPTQGGKGLKGGSLTQGGTPPTGTPQSAVGGDPGRLGGPPNAYNSGKSGMPGSTGGATAVQQLPPALQAIENARTTTTANTLADVLGRQNAISNGGLPSLVTGLDQSGLPGLPQNPENFRQDITNAFFQSGADPLMRTFGRQWDIIQQDLANKGLGLGGEAASNVIQDFSYGQNQALQNLALQSAVQGGQEASRSLGDLLNIRGTGMGEQVQNASLAQNSRLTQLNELNALLGLPQVGAPPIQSFLQTSPTDVMGAYGLNQQGNIANANNSMQMKGSLNSGLANLGSSYMLSQGMKALPAMSDRRLKSDIRKIGEINGVNVYSYEIFGEDSVGVMADEVPWASFKVNGISMVDYARVF